MENDTMAPMQAKTEKALAAAFISNCGAQNFRLQALDALEKTKNKIDSHGGFHPSAMGEEFAPSSGSFLHIKVLSSVAEVSKKMKDLAEVSKKMKDLSENP
ncbi:hypothetical protein SAY86_024134 [Trapa natans]|uniref:Uncharacterized protein n=1 Tax=Trapa natans TaxID=22666 RepID=A0AAN7R6D8_TRANT|nr:hypothetical protein SAY86_024134 [Trapa natans]